MKKIAIAAVIDDDKIFQLAAKRILDATAKVDQIIQLWDGEEAINYLLANKSNSHSLPTILFLDLNMPYLDGWEFLQSYVANGFVDENIHVYICTASQFREDYELSLQFRFVKGFLIKSNLLDQITVAINTVIEQSSEGFE